MKKSDQSCKDFDSLIFFRRNAKKVQIPSYIKKINSYAFDRCNQLKYLTFEAESSLETIDENAISYNYNLKSIVFPPSLKLICETSIDCNYKLKFVEFLGQHIKITGY